MLATITRPFRSVKDSYIDLKPNSSAVTSPKRSCPRKGEFDLFLFPSLPASPRWLPFHLFPPLLHRNVHVRTSPSATSALAAPSSLTLASSSLSLRDLQPYDIPSRPSPASGRAARVSEHIQHQAQEGDPRPYRLFTRRRSKATVSLDSRATGRADLFFFFSIATDR